MSDINYELLLNRAMRSVVKEALSTVAKNGIPGKHFFYITFLTDFNGVKLSPRMQKKYTKDMTIVMEHQFTNLIVEEDRFSVTLSFNGAKENICVPYKAIVRFADPSAGVDLKLTILEDYNDNQCTKDVINFKEKIKVEAQPSNVVYLDQFRKK
jgi:hypothetical protein